MLGKRQKVAEEAGRVYFKSLRYWRCLWAYSSVPNSSTRTFIFQGEKSTPYFLIRHPTFIFFRGMVGCSMMYLGPGGGVKIHCYLVTQQNHRHSYLQVHLEKIPLHLLRLLRLFIFEVFSRPYDYLFLYHYTAQKSSPRGGGIFTIL